jgi:hypothetical protein
MEWLLQSKKAVLFDEKEKIKSGASGQHVLLASKSNQLWASNEDRNAGDTLDGPNQMTALVQKRWTSMDSIVPM